MKLEINDVIRGLKATKERIVKQAWYAIQAKKFADEIKIRTRAMSNSIVSNGTNEVPLAKLSQSYVHQRKTSLKSKLLTPRITSKSCLTLTGEMLNSIKTKVIVTNNDIKMVLFFTGFNAKKAEWAETGRPDRPKRPFFHFSHIQLMAFYRDYDTYVSDVLNKYFDIT